jgi:hypothetical protein
MGDPERSGRRIKQQQQQQAQRASSEVGGPGAEGNKIIAGGGVK